MYFSVNTSYKKNMIKEELEFLEEWFLLKKYELKLLTIITVLADNKRAFRGKLSDLCNELSISNCSKNKETIKNSLLFLEKNDYIKDRKSVV